MDGTILEARDLLNHLRRGRHQVAGRRVVFYSLRIRREITESGGADHVGPAHRLDETFDAVSHPPFSDGLDESLIFELSDVVVDLLPRHSDSPCKTRRRLGLTELAEYLDPKGVKRGCRRRALVDHMYGRGHRDSHIS